MEDKVTIRRYTNSDKAAVIALLRLNTPRYFSPEEEKDFVHYLENEIEDFYVLLLDGQVIGCGGINYRQNGTVGYLSWGMLHTAYQRQGLGTKLLNYRLHKLKNEKKTERIVVRTSQLVYPFYVRHGFVLVEQVKDYWAPGFDLYTMEYRPV